MKSNNARSLPKDAVLIPKNAMKVFSGEIFDVYQWPQKMFDGSVETFEMLRRPDAVLIIAEDDNGEILACNEEQPGGIVRKNHLPAGRVDVSDSTLLEAAQRELQEETGYTFAEWCLVDVVQPEKKIEWFVYTFAARNIVDIQPTQHDPGEKIEVTKITYGQLVVSLSEKIPALKKHATFEELFATAQALMK